MTSKADHHTSAQCRLRPRRNPEMMVRSLLRLSALPPSTHLPPLVRILHCQTSEKFPIRLVKARLTMEDHWADYGGA